MCNSKTSSGKKKEKRLKLFNFNKKVEDHIVFIQKYGLIFAIFLKEKSNTTPVSSLLPKF